MSETILFFKDRYRDRYFYATIGENHVSLQIRQEDGGNRPYIQKI